PSSPRHSCRGAQAGALCREPTCRVGDSCDVLGLSFGHSARRLWRRKACVVGQEWWRHEESPAGERGAGEAFSVHGMLWPRLAPSGVARRNEWLYDFGRRGISHTRRAMTRLTAELAYDLHAGLASLRVPEFDELQRIGMAATLAIHIKGLGGIDYDVLRKV